MNGIIFAHLPVSSPKVKNEQSCTSAPPCVPRWHKRREVTSALIHICLSLYNTVYQCIHVWCYMFCTTVLSSSMWAKWIMVCKEFGGKWSCLIWDVLLVFVLRVSEKQWRASVVIVCVALRFELEASWNVRNLQYYPCCSVLFMWFT
jgi:hypothetical protein